MRSDPQWMHVLLFLLLSLCAWGERFQEKPADLVPGKTLRYAMKHGDERLVMIRVSKGFFARIIVEQVGFDVKVAVVAPAGEQIAWVDRPNGAYGPEAISFIAPELGSYAVKLTTSMPFSSAGKIYVRWVAYRPALPEDANRIRAEKLCTEAEALRSSLQEASMRQAISMLTEDVELWRKLNDPYEVAVALYDKGLAARYLGLFADAERYFRQSIALMHQQKRVQGEGASWAGLGWVYFAVGDESKTKACFRKVLALDRQVGNLGGMGTSYYALGGMEFFRSNYQRAAILLEQARKLFLTVGYQEGTALANSRLAAVLVARRQYDLALDQMKTALDQFSELHDEYGHADALLTMGVLMIQQERTGEAAQVLQQALQFFQSTGNRMDTLFCRFLLARVAIEEHRLSDARSQLESLVNDAETVKLQVAGEDERMLYVATLQDYYGLLSRVLLQLDQQEPGKGFVVRAFDVFERATSQALTGKLALLQLPAGSASMNPLQFRPGMVQDLADHGLPSDSVLLGYFLNQYCSCAFVVTPDKGIQAFSLPEVDRIAGIVALALRRSGNSWSAPGSTERLRQLGHLLLVPAASQLQGRRNVVVVSQGALDLLPFVLLPDPNSPAKLMVDSYDVMQAPSASYLAFAQSRPSRAHQKELLVFADPVLDNGDPRLKPQTPKAARPKTSIPSRLVFTRLEAEQITGSLPKTQYTEVYGFAFAKKAIQSGFLNRYRYIHFATHAEADDRFGTGGALVLSRFNERGERVPYLLTGDEIDRLELTGQIVTLSACRTSAGLQIHGEGVIGLTRSFLYAGAGSVIASKWVVDDRATAELMARLYCHLLTLHESPARALAQAQREMRSLPRWRSPYYWASFGVYGMGSPSAERPQQP